MSNAALRGDINKSFLHHLRADFAEHGKDVIERVRKIEPEKYLDTVAKLLPKELAISVITSPLDSLTPDELRLLSARLAGLEKLATANSDEIDAFELPRELLTVRKDIIA